MKNIDFPYKCVNSSEACKPTLLWVVTFAFEDIFEYALAIRLELFLG